jgi:hypothetical protein
MTVRWLPLLAITLAGCAKQTAPEDAARQFFELVITGKAAQAYESAAFGFRAQQTQSFFQTTLVEVGLDTITSAKYERPEYDSDRRFARVAAEFTTKSKAIIKLVIGLVRDDGAWRVLSLKSPRNPRTGAVENRFTMIGREPAFGDLTVKHPAPDLAASKALTLNSLLAFNDAVQRKDFLNLFDEASLHWQDQLVTREGPAAIPGTMKRALTPKERELGASRLQHAFQSFIDQNINIAGIQGTEPVFDRPPWVNTDGLLVLSGHYPTKPYRVFFALKFYYEVPAWRLFGIDVQVRKAGAQ